MIYYKFKKLENIYYFCEIDYIFKTEKWKDIPDYEGFYQISDLGRIKSLSRKIKNEYFKFTCKEKIRSQTIDTPGYLQVRLSKNGTVKAKRVHKMIGEIFLGADYKSFPKYVLDHINNNQIDNRSINLQFISQRINLIKDKKQNSGFYGVQKRGNSYSATITINGKPKRLGSFNNPQKASLAYNIELNKILKDEIKDIDVTHIKSKENEEDNHLFI